MSEVSGTVNGVSVGAAYDYDSLGRLKEYTPGVPSGYGTISYTWNTLGQKTSMTVPFYAAAMSTTYADVMKTAVGLLV